MRIRLSPGALIALLAATLWSASCANTTAPATGSPQALLAAVAKSDVRDFWTNDFGRQRRSGGFSTIVPEAEARVMLASVRRQLMPGHIAFIGTTRDLSEDHLNGVELVVAPGHDQFDILRLAATDAINYGMTTDQIIAELQQWDSQFGIDIWQASTDTVQLDLNSLPSDVPAFSRKLYEFCPDIVDQGVGDVEALQRSIKHERAVILWWD